MLDKFIAANSKLTLWSA